MFYNSDFPTCDYRLPVQQNTPTTEKDKLVALKNTQLLFEIP